MGKAHYRATQVNTHKGILAMSGNSPLCITHSDAPHRNRHPLQGVLIRVNEPKPICSPSPVSSRQVVMLRHLYLRRELRRAVSSQKRPERRRTPIAAPDRAPSALALRINQAKHTQVITPTFSPASGVTNRKHQSIVSRRTIQQQQLLLELSC